MKVLSLILVLVAGFANSQLVNNVRLVNHTDYVVTVLNQVALELERKEWCNLKLPDVTTVLNETVLDRHYEGTVTYSNGFLTSLQHIDIKQLGINQVWSWNSTDETGTVLVSGTLRMTDLGVGYDVETNLEDGRHRHTVVVTVPLVLFTFNIRRNVNTEEVHVNVEGSIRTRATVNTVKFLPLDETAELLTALFDVRMPEVGILDWGEHVFAPITLDVYHKVDFPVICYDCPITAAG